MPKGSKPYPYNRAPKTGGMPPTSPKPKPKAAPRARPSASRATSGARAAPSASPWFDTKTGRAWKPAAQAAARAAAPIAEGAAAGARMGAGRAGVIGAAVGLAAGAIIGVAEMRRRNGGTFGGKDRGRGAPMNKGPSVRNRGQSPASTKAVAQATAPAKVDSGAKGLSNFGKAFKEAEYKRRKLGGPAVFSWNGKMYKAEQKGRKY